MAKRKQRETNTAVSFIDQIRSALNHFDDPQWLGEHSPLSAPYFLGQALFEQSNSVRDAENRGHALKQAIIIAANTLWQDELPKNKDELITEASNSRQEQGYKGGKYLYFILELRYFRRYFRPSERPYANNELAISHFLDVSRASYFNHLKVAQQQLGDALLKATQPTFRLEQPPKLPQKFVGREAFTQKALLELENGRSVSISGASGVGKTALGSTIAHQWHAENVFWFTLRPSFNDRLSSLLFSFGYFLHLQGSSALWQQLIADNGKIEDYNLALAHIRGDWESCSEPILVCIDEIDILQTEPDQTTVSQSQLLAFFESLCDVLPILFIGQKPLILASSHIEIANFSLQEATYYFNTAEITLTLDEQKKLHFYTGGNPRLLQLCLALYKGEMSIDDIVKKIPQMPTLQALWSRLWQRFSSEEQQLLCNLSVFRSSAPEDAWLDETVALQQLRQWRIVLVDARGGLSLLPTIRDLVYSDRQRFPAEHQEVCHIKAAQIRANRGEFTLAAYHYFKAGAMRQMVQVWFPNRLLEIQRGQGSIALPLFEQLSARSLPKAERQALAILRAELYGLVGQIEEGVATLNRVNWPSRSEVTVAARLLQGDFLNALGQPYRAIERYDAGIEVITRLQMQLTHYRCQRAVLFAQQREMAVAKQEADLAQYEAIYLQGIIQEESGRFQEAQHQFTQALELATSASYERGMAQSHYAISKIYGRLADIEKTAHHSQEAMRYYHRIGDKLTEEIVRSTLAATYLQAGKFQEAISAAETAVTFFASAQNSYWEAVTASTLAEAYYEEGQLEKATQTAQRVLSLEESYTQPYAYFTLGLVAKAQDQFDVAEKHFQICQQVATHNEDYYLAAYAWRGLGETLLAMRKIEEGKTAVDHALTLFEKLGLSQEIERTYKIKTSL